MLKVSEVYQKQTRVHHERPDGTEYVNFGKSYTTRECLLNPHYIVAAYSCNFASDTEREKACEAFPSGTKFTTLILDGNSFRNSEIIVVGSFEKFCSKLQGSP